MFGVLKLYYQTVMVFANITSPKGRIALQVAREITSCDGKQVKPISRVKDTLSLASSMCPVSLLFIPFCGS